MTVAEIMKKMILDSRGHHHTLTDIEGADYQILIEADYLVNADEGRYSEENVRSTLEKVFQTASGKALLQSVYLN